MLNSDTAADSKVELVDTLVAELERCEWPASLEWVLHRSAALHYCSQQLCCTGQLAVNAEVRTDLVLQCWARCALARPRVCTGGSWWLLVTVALEPAGRAVAGLARQATVHPVIIMGELMI